MSNKTDNAIIALPLGCGCLGILAVGYTIVHFIHKFW